MADMSIRPHTVGASWPEVTPLPSSSPSALRAAPHHSGGPMTHRRKKVPEMPAFQPSVTISADRFPLTLTYVGPFTPVPGSGSCGRVSAARCPLNKDFPKGGAVKSARVGLCAHYLGEADLGQTSSCSQNLILYLSFHRHSKELLLSNPCSEQRRLSHNISPAPESPSNASAALCPHHG